jgi:hypothetical protein
VKEIMNGLLPVNTSAVGSTDQNGSAEKLRTLLQRTASSTKVTLGAHRGVFDLDKDKIENFYHLIDQRIQEQNGCDASSCEVSIYYTDASSRRFPTIEEFKGYAETRNRFPTVAILHLSYFISFPGSDAPERQDVELTIRSSDVTSETIDVISTDNRLRVSGDHVHFLLSTNESSYGVITYTIHHTRVSWGLDLEGHIRGHIEKLMEYPGFWDRTISKSAGPLNLITTVFVGLYCSNLIIDFFFRFLYQTDGGETSDEILDIAASYLVNGQIAKYVVASLVVSVVFFVAFSALISSLTSSMKKPRPSFISLDDGDLKRRGIKLRHYNRRWTHFGTVIAMDIAVGILIFFAEERIRNILPSLF